MIRFYTKQDLGQEFEPLSCFSEAADFSDLLCDFDNWVFQIKSNDYAEDGYVVGDYLIFKGTDVATPGELVLYANELGIIRLGRYTPLRDNLKILRPSGRYEIVEYSTVTVFGIVTGLIRRTAKPVTIEQWNSIAPPRPEPINQWKPVMEWL